MSKKTKKKVVRSDVLDDVDYDLLLKFVDRREDENGSNQ